MSHVAFILPTIDRLGGAERQCLLLSRGLSGRGWQVSVVALSGDGGSMAQELRAAGIRFQSLEMRKGIVDPRGWLRFRHWLHEHAPDVVHAHLAHATWFARWSRICTPARVLVDTLHSASTGSAGRRLGYRVSNWLTDRVTAVSQAAAEAHLCPHVVPPGKLGVLPNGVDVERWRPAHCQRATQRRGLGLGTEFLWLAVGRLEPVKDYSILLRAMAQLSGPVHLAIAGGGSLENELHLLAAQLGLTNRVRFLGFQQDVCRWMQAADAFVLSSQWEGLPMSLLEAGACELPAVATDVPGTHEALLDGRTGFLAAAGNVASLRDAMQHMMQLSPTERCAMGQRARSFVAAHFSLESTLDRWEALYRELLAHNPVPRHRGRFICLPGERSSLT